MIAALLRPAKGAMSAEEEWSGQKFSGISS